MINDDLSSVDDAAGETKRKRVILCSICARGPLFEDGAQSLFANGSDAAGRPLRFCAEHLPIDAVRQGLGRQNGPLLEAAISTIFQRRLGEEAGQ